MRDAPAGRPLIRTSQTTTRQHAATRGVLAFCRSRLVGLLTAWLTAWLAPWAGARAAQPGGAAPGAPGPASTPAPTLNASGVPEVPVAFAIEWSPREGFTNIDAPTMAASVASLLRGDERTRANWLGTLLQVASRLAAHPGAATLSVVKWANENNASDGAFIVTLPAGPGNRAEFERALDAVMGSPTPPGSKLTIGGRACAWSWSTGSSVRVGVGEAGVAALGALTRPNLDEFQAHVRTHLKALGGGEVAGPLRIWIDLNLLRRQAPDRFADGPEGRLLAAFGVSNARALSVFTRLGPSSPVLERRTRLLQLSLAWSARSWAPGTVRSGVLGESAWPAGLNIALPASPAWVLATRTDVGASPLALGWGGLIRRLATIGPALLDSRAAADEAGEAQQRWFGEHSEEQRTLTRALNPWLVVTPGDDPASAGLTFAAPLRDSVLEDERGALAGALRTLLAPVGNGGLRGQDEAPAGAPVVEGVLAPGWSLRAALEGVGKPRGVVLRLRAE